jgi:hypothetical protein
MRVTHTHRAAALLTGLAATLTAGSASAAVWTWACQGELNDQRIVFDRDGLYIASGKAPAGKLAGMPAKFTMQSIENAIAAVRAAGGFTEFSPEDGNGGLESPITFSLAGDGKQPQKVVFTEKSSKRTAHQHRLVQCGSRDEDVDLYQKVYRYERDGEPARTITMQCMEYQLSTKGGRKGCGDGD